MISFGVAIVVCGLAIRFGDKPARRVGMITLGGWVVSLIVFRNSARFADIGLMAVDGVIAALFVWVSLSSRRLWTVVVAAFQMLGVASHLATVIDHRVTINTYKLSLAVWSYGILVMLAVAVWRHWREQRRVADERV
ncbi:hypothetical protein DDF62_16800 [Caulobacter radicis]|uniref:hypothetical protein n=1 Tax=Caulobacter radicis TaxID=2172650 RepID=UPI000D5877B6|nr:hypothetical protein [Caulobacter radicis]PVM87290.1 hypothetical protein DDF62_16800 [Caulobacter radicis]